MPDSPADIEAQKTALQDRFRDFKDVRSDNWRPLAQRELMPYVPEHVKANAQKVPVLVPVLEDNINSDTLIMTQNEPEIMVIDQGNTQESKADCEDMRLYFEVLRNRLNHGGRIEKAIATHFVWPDGVAAVRINARKPSEYGGEEQGSEYDRARQEHLLSQEEETFSMKPIDPKTLAWWPLENPTEIVEDIEIDIGETERLYRRSDGATARSLLNIPGEPADLGTRSTSITGKTVHFVVYEYLDEKDGCWWRCEYVDDGTTILGPRGETLSQGLVELDRSKLPHKGSSYEIIPGGNTNWSEQTDPHRRYRPKLYSLGVWVERYNTQLTLEQACIFSQLSDRGVYLSIPAQGLNDDSRRAMDILFPGWQMMEGGGSDDSLVAQLPVRREGQLLLMPGIIHAFPGFVSTLQSIYRSMETTERWIQTYSTNLFLTGRNYQQVSEGTSGANALAAQNSGTTYGPHREQIDAFWARAFRKVANCMITWDEENEGKPLKYPATSTHEGGNKTVWVDARKASRPYAIKLQTLVETQQERLIRIQAAEHMYEVGRIGFEDLLREDGHDDPHRKARELAAEGNLYMWQRENEAILMARRQVLTQTMLGFNLQAIGERAMQLAAPQGEAPPPQGGPPPGAPSGNGRPAPMPEPFRRPGGPPAVAPTIPAAGGV